MANTHKLTDLVVTGDVLKLVGAIDEFKGAWKAIGRIAPERLLSNLDIKAFASRDEQEVAGYAESMETVFAHWEVIDLTENHIRQLHRDLLKYSTEDVLHRGE